MSDIIKKQIEVYQKSFLEHGDTPKGTNQNDRDTQNVRFQKLLKNILDIHKAKFTIHDFGSGLCDLHKYMLDNNIEHEYSGTEIVPEMVETSQKKYPGIKVYNRDIFNDKMTDTYDFNVVCGTFYIPGNVKHNEWKEFILKSVKKLFEISNCGISFNLLTTHKTRTDESLFYMDPQEAFDFCVKNLSRFVLIDHSMPLYEYTTTVFKKDYVKSLYSSVAFEKYFK
jgi:hypothetical protein